MKCNNGHFDKDIRSSGITTVDADFQVFSSDIEDEDNRTEFNNQKFGITALKTIGGLRSLKVSNALFDNCQYGIRSEMATGDAIANNLFKVQDDTEEGDPINHLGKYNSRYGVYELRSLSYTLSNNAFVSKSGSYYPGIKTYGEVSEGYHTDFGWGTLGNINHNTFDHLRISTQLEHNQLYTEVLCNDYQNTGYSWVVNPLGHSWASLAWQGSGCDEFLEFRAGNSFDNANNTIYNRSPYYWKYFASDETDKIPGFVTNSTWNSLGLSANVCVLGSPDESCDPSGGGGCDFCNLQAYHSVRQTAKAAAKAFKSEFETTSNGLDNGQRSSLLAHLANGSYNNDTLAAEIIAAGLLSDTVLNRVTARYPAFSESKFVAIVNHNSPVSEKVWKDVAKTIAGYSSTNRDSVTNAQKTDTLRTLTIIKGDINQAETRHHQAIRQILGYYATADTTDAVHDTVMAFLVDTVGTQPFRKLAIGYGLETGRIADARAMLDTLPLATAHDTSFYNYYNIAVSLAEDSLTWFGMDSTQAAKVSQVAKTDYDEAYLAQAVLSLINDTAYHRMPEPLPEDTVQYRVEQHPTQPTYNDIANAENQFKVFPNPSENNFTFNYTLAQKVLIEVTVRDLQGRLVFQKSITEAETGELQIDLSPCNGMYILYVTNGLKQIYNHKLVCISR